MRSVRSAPWEEATARTPGVGSTAKLAGATAKPSRTRKRRGTAAKRLEPKQARRVLAEDLVLLPPGEILARADARDRVRKLRVEVRIVARHEDVILAQLGDRPREIGLVGFAGHVAVAAYVLGGRHLEHARDLREVPGPLPVVVHAVHPVEDPLGAAFEEDHLELRGFLEHAAQHECDQRRAAVGRAPEHVRLVEIVEPVDQLPIAVRMAEQRHAELLGRLVIGVEARVVEIARAAVGHEVRSPEAELLDAAPQLIGHGLGTAGRRHRDRQKDILVTFHQLRDPVVEKARALAPQPADIRGRDGDLRREYQLLVDAFLADVLAAASHVVTAHLPRGDVPPPPIGLRVVDIVLPVGGVFPRAMIRRHRVLPFPESLPMKVSLFVTCLVDLMRPSVGFAALKLLEAANYEVVVPKTQTCCGQPGWNSGDRKSARALARKLIAEFEGCRYVVAPSGSCAGMIRTHFPEVFRDEPFMLARAERLGERTYELTEFLVKVAKRAIVPGSFDGAVTYHDSCSGLRELGVKAQPRRLLAKVAGLKLVEMEECETCCGFGGTFSIKYGEISSAMAENKCAHIQASGARAVVLGALGCMLTIEGRRRRRGDAKTQVLHVAEVLAGEN